MMDNDIVKNNDPIQLQQMIIFKGRVSQVQK